MVEWRNGGQITEWQNGEWSNGGNGGNEGQNGQMAGMARMMVYQSERMAKLRNGSKGNQNNIITYC
jgi:hypothetical protein